MRLTHKIFCKFSCFSSTLQDEDVESKAGQVRRHASFSSRGSEKTEQAAIKRHASSESPVTFHNLLALLHKNFMGENVASASLLLQIKSLFIWMTDDEASSPWFVAS